MTKIKFSKVKRTINGVNIELTETLSGIRYSLSLSMSQFKALALCRQNATFEQALESFRDNWDNRTLALSDDAWEILNPSHSASNTAPQEQPIMLKQENFINMMDFIAQDAARKKIFQDLSKGKSLDGLCTLNFTDFVHSGKTNLSARFRFNPGNASPAAPRNIYFDIPLSEEQLQFKFLEDVNPESIKQFGENLVLSEFSIAVVPDGLMKIINNIPDNKLTICPDGSKVYPLSAESLHPIIVTLLGYFDVQETDGETHWYLKQA